MAYTHVHPSPKKRHTKKDNSLPKKENHLMSLRKNILNIFSGIFLSFFTYVQMCAYSPLCGHMYFFSKYFCSLFRYSSSFNEKTFCTSKSFLRSPPPPKNMPASFRHQHHHHHLHLHITILKKLRHIDLLSRGSSRCVCSVKSRQAAFFPDIVHRFFSVNFY